ncbi:MULTISPECIES: XTP/dITP diphosphatase [Clostridium]|uniref:dITP/XTP pyrophosphatase n=3 Tax=Clostridium TaxID=1485 RepID=D8GTB2_CLOLD|nr:MULTISPECIES: XTP/dITP diphosphatase [Clostridium]ADK16711.1 putative xanthosine triphosphate pyrophosphatase [Clostridium ljungdahlii DSM 13528]AGY75769.1 XTP/dITP diphosphatase [Clostridium autoethanogenum DSM 10061]ALU35934.1 Nucleoside-triphosphatase rdgB [Clostridium autoethanogenum DSM 10061]OAA89413.1 Non-canonical purine NTP pyrophosphatase [Clostridium ljungdahlii DSM 13528]OVY52008.1 Non-canonical purine NTP pyrophosphatase [Clostridium autoethanogenum]
MKKLVVASNNCNKIREIKQILSKYPIEILSMKDMNLNVDILEDGKTFSENAYKKASTIYHILQDKCMVLADDSGLMVKGLNGAPGVYSARFAGEHGNDKKNNEKLLKLLEGMKPQDREAKFVCALVLIVDSKRTFKVEGEVNGIICDEERGNNKFGYDPLFYVPEYHKTFGELPYEIKNSISHRANALKKLKEQMRDIMEEV